MFCYLFNCVDQAIIATDLEGQVLYFNKAAEDLYQWLDEEALKRNIIEVTAHQMSTQQAQEIMENLTKGEKWSGEFMVQRKDGITFMAHVTDSPIQDDDGNLIGIVGVSCEIS